MKKKRKENDLKNWKTTVGGLLAGVPQLLVSVGLIAPTNKWAALASAVGMVWLGTFSKDHNVTGGEIRQ